MTERLAAAVVVVGAGPAGIAAACAAAEAGADTLVLDENTTSGGQIWRRGAGAPPAEATPWLDRLRRSGARLEPATSIFETGGLESGESILLAERDGAVLEIAFEHLVVATGARELFLPFPGWTLPGVLGLGGLQAMVKSGASVAGQRVVVAGSGPLILPVAATCAAKGARLVAVAEQASGAQLRAFALSLWRSPAKWAQAAALRSRFLSTRYRSGTWVESAAGDESIAQVTLTDGRTRRTLSCDLLAASYGLVPNLELARRLGCEVNGHQVFVDAAQRSSVDGVLCAGEVCGIGGIDTALAEGEIAGATAAGVEAPSGLLRRRDAGRRFARRLAEAFSPRRELLERVGGDTLVCRCEDVAWGDIRADWSMRQAKLYRRVGMGPCQGRVCGPALEHLCGWEPDTVRPPLKPVSAATLAAAGED